jgi:hypothetical protein
MQLHALAQFPIPKAVAGDAPRRRRSAGGHPLFPLRHTRRTSAARAHRRSLPRGAPLLSNNIARPRRDSDATPPARFDGLAPCGGAVGLGRGQAARGTVDWSSYGDATVVLQPGLSCSGLDAGTGRPYPCSLVRN